MKTYFALSVSASVSVSLLQSLCLLSSFALKRSGGRVSIQHNSHSSWPQLLFGLFNILTLFTFMPFSFKLSIILLPQDVSAFLITSWMLATQHSDFLGSNSQWPLFRVKCILSLPLFHFPFNFSLTIRSCSGILLLINPATWVYKLSG